MQLTVGWYNFEIPVSLEMSELCWLGRLRFTGAYRITLYTGLVKP
jgi:hypothetical protein